MRVLLDEDLDHRLRKSLGVHEVFTVGYLGWAGLKNGELLGAAEQRGIDVFVTGDQNLGYQQNLEARRWRLSPFPPRTGPLSEII